MVRARAPRSSTARAPASYSRSARPASRGTRSASPAELLSDDSSPFDERGELLLHHPARRLPESTIRVEPEFLGRDVLQDRTDPLRHVGRRLGLERLDVDHAGAELLVGRELLPEAEVFHAAVGEFEDDLGGTEVAQDRIEVAKVAHGRERPAVEVPEAHVYRDLRLDPLDHPVHALVEAWRRAGVHPAVRLVDLDEVGARL